MAIVPRAKLDLWVTKHKNVMFVGEHGVGKTAIIEETWNRHGLKFLYFSAANMDPWIDLVGVPRERSMVVDGKTVDYIECVPPKALALDEVDAIFFDEYNRAPEKVRNATMQFIQRKEVNGRKFNRLKMIWIAINPDDTGEYDVQTLDPAQRDRFHVHYSIPYRPDEEYFINKYGTTGSKFVSWWHKLPADAKRQVSPRRLDYAAEMWFDDGDMEDVLGPGINLSELISVIDKGTIEERLNLLRNNPKTTDEDKAAFIQNDNNFQQLKPMLDDLEVFNYFAAHMEDERVLSITSEKFTMIDRFVNNAGHNPDKVELLKKHSTKSHIIPDLCLGLGAKIFGHLTVEKLAKMKTEEGVVDFLQDAVSQKDNLYTPNGAYAVAAIYSNSVTTWPTIATRIKHVADAINAALTSNNLQGYFSL